MHSSPAKRKHPTLPKSAFAAAAPLPARRTYPLALVDTHIHLWSKPEFDRGTFRNSDTRTLPAQADLELYSALTSAAVHDQWEGTSQLGFVYVQAEANHDDSDLDGSKGGWDDALREIEDVCRQAIATPTPKLLALCPWAPVHAGPVALKTYFERLEALPSLVALTASSGGPRALVTAVRFLLQDEPTGTCVADQFVAGLKWLGEQGVAFDITLDVSTRGPAVLEEALECISKVHAGQPECQETRFIFDHLAKPDLVSEPTAPPSPAHAAYVRNFYAFALLPNVSVKLSGLLDYAAPALVRSAFAEFCAAPTTAASETKWGTPRRPSVSSIGGGRPSFDHHHERQQSQSSSSLAGLKRRVVTFLEPLLEAFGESRIVIGSDWPMFRIPVFDGERDQKDIAEEAQAWSFQFHLYRLCLLDLGLEGDSLDLIFAGNSKAFYRIQ